VNIYTGYYPIHHNISFSSYNINSQKEQHEIKIYIQKPASTSIKIPQARNNLFLLICQKSKHFTFFASDFTHFLPPLIVYLFIQLFFFLSAPHVVEWKHKCVGKKQPDGSLQFLYSMNTIKYDGENFLIFDEKKKVWIPVTENAKQIERKLDRDEGLKEFIMGYMKNKCMDLLKVFVYCENEQQTKPPPEVHVFAKNSSINANLILICLATGFFTKKIIMRIKRNGRVLDKDDGLKSSGVVLNSDNSFQRRDQVEILKSDVAENFSVSTVKVNSLKLMLMSCVTDRKIPPKKPFGIETPFIVLMGFIVFLFIGVPLVLMVFPSKFRVLSNSVLFFCCFFFTNFGFTLSK
uniref:Immunoglobulin C1-set domain-containing protein n=1 Tax=Pundamilia nyererei TaxID=303518 RepID=A0A3B4H6Q8_9CICH